MKSYIKKIAIQFAFEQVYETISGIDGVKARGYTEEGTTCARPRRQWQQRDVAERETSKTMASLSADINAEIGNITL